ncbi:Ectonucleotide pyrophosphatase/phosphodiesterase family member 1 [Linum perenne]
MGSESALTATKPTQIPTQEEDQSSQSASLLALSTEDPSSSLQKPTTTTIIFIALILVTCVALSAASAFAFLFFSAKSIPPITNDKTARPLTKLDHPVVLVISSDGFRFGYQHKTPTPNIGRLIANGTEAETGLIPVFPTLTFPNHYSIVTGLYPAYHGIINNKFIDPRTGDVFTMASHDPRWWLVPFVDRVDTILSYFDLPSSEIPVFMTLYFEDPDHQGHQVGPDDPQITEAVANIDGLIGRLIDGLEKRGVFEDVTVIMLGDHGMVGTCDKKLIFLDDLAEWVNIPKEWVPYYSPVLSIRPPTNVNLSDVVAKMNQGLQSGKVENGKNLKMFLKEDLPIRLHYSDSERIPPIIGILGEGFKVEQKRTMGQECGGAHGYDNAYFSMRTIFIAHGPQFAKGVKVPSFENIQIYNVIASILNIKGAPNNGSSSFPQSILLQKP